MSAPLLTKYQAETNNKIPSLLKVERRGFMFIDLNESTQIAEYLGENRYSRFLKTCFLILEESLDDSVFQIYQFVGDEAVVTWYANDPEHSLLAIRAFYKFQKILKSYAPMLYRSYKVKPEFKCAIHLGDVIRTSVGISNPQLAFHGDVLNSASRVLGLCKPYEAELLITEPVKQELTQGTNSGEYQLYPLGDLYLRGKNNSLNIYKLFF